MYKIVVFDPKTEAFLLPSDSTEEELKLSSRMLRNAIEKHPNSPIIFVIHASAQIIKKFDNET